MKRPNATAPSVHHLRFGARIEALLSRSARVVGDYRARIAGDERRRLGARPAERLEQANVTRLMRSSAARLPRAPPHLGRGPRAVLARGRSTTSGSSSRRPWERVARHLGRARVGDVVRRRPAQPRARTASTAGRSAGPTTAAAVSLGEDGERRALTYARALGRRPRLAEALAALGVEAGDRVAIFLPMSPEVAVASHACAHLGAVQVPIFSGFARAGRRGSGSQASEAKVVISADGSLRRGRWVPMRETVDEARRRRRRSSTSSCGTAVAASGRSSCGGSPGRCRRSRSTPSTRTCSRTRRARPASRRASSTCRAASSSRSRARSRTRPTCTRATSSTSPPTWAGSWARGRSSAAARSARRSSSRKARPTGRPTGSGARSRRSA